MKDLAEDPVRARRLWIPISWIASIGVACASAMHVADEFKTALNSNTEAITALTKQIDKAYTSAQHAHWVRVFQSLNPNLRLPPEDK